MSAEDKKCGKCGSSRHIAIVCMRNRKARNAKRYKYLSHEEEVRLARRWRKRKDRRALNALVSAFFPGLIMYLSRGFQNFFPLDDLLQEGALGLVRAAERYDPDRGVRFYTYATYWIRAFLISYTFRMGHVVRVGTRRSDRDIIFGLNKANQKLAMTGEMVSTEDLAAELGVSIDQVMDIRQRVFREDLSLSTLMGDSEDLTLESLLGEDPKQEEEAAHHEAQEQRNEMTEKALLELLPREQTIIRARFLSEDPQTLQELANTFDLSRERVRQLQDRALKKLKVLLREDYEALEEEAA